jgi:streptomycin 6-kinase
VRLPFVTSVAIVISLVTSKASARCSGVSVERPHHLTPKSRERSSKETIAALERWPDAGLVQEGLRLFEDLPQNSDTAVLLATDLHAGNTLKARREPWLVIDPKPHVGDPAYDPRSTCSTAP